MKMFMRRVGNCLVPDGDESISEMSHVPFGKSVSAEIRQSRNIQFHKLYWSLCARIANGIGKDAESVSTVFKYATGHCETIKTKSYGEIKIPKSISFAKLDETGFREFFNRCLVCAFEEWGLDADAFSDLLDPKTEMRA